MVELDDLAKRLRHNADNHLRGIPLARRVTMQQLFEAADAIDALSTARSEGAREATERAAKVAEEHDDETSECRDGAEVARTIAAAIRAQGETG
jgi:hypothetical protein